MDNYEIYLMKSHNCASFFFSPVLPLTVKMVCFTSLYQFRISHFGTRDLHGMVCSLINVNAAPDSLPAKDLNKQGDIFLMPFPHYWSECPSSVDIICTQMEKQQSVQHFHSLPSTTFSCTLKSRTCHRKFINYV